MQYAYVTTNLLDMWESPTYDCERVSQLFWGETVKTSDRNEQFMLVRQPDGYEGWVDSKFLVSLTLEEYDRSSAASDAVVCSPTAMIFSDTRGQLQDPFFLFFGTRLRIKPLKSAFVKTRSPDGEIFYIKKTDIRPMGKDMQVPVAGNMIVDEARRFLGVPYLWGGISNAGFDCSGFVRTLFSSFGVYLPRDTKDQISTGEAVPRTDIRCGDLIFFKRHVAVAIDPVSFIHSSRGGGGVRINSLDSSAPYYRVDLDQNFSQARRVL